MKVSLSSIVFMCAMSLFLSQQVSANEPAAAAAPAAPAPVVAAPTTTTVAPAAPAAPVVQAAPAPAAKPKVVKPAAAKPAAAPVVAAPAVAAPAAAPAASAGPQGSGTCTKKIAETKVDQVCSDIVAKGVAAKDSWPAGLLFQNCGDNYIWVQDITPEIKMVMHPIKRRLDGTSLTAHEDENHFKLFIEFDKAAKANPGGAWVDYMWAKPGAEKATPKTSYVKICKSKDGTAWLAGSGVWKDDLK